MVSFEQYPYKLQKFEGATASQDADGHFVNTGTDTWVDVCFCRNQNAKNKQFTVSDSKYLVATFLIHCPLGTDKLNANQIVRVLNQDNSVRLQGQVIYSEEKQLHTQIWV